MRNQRWYPSRISDAVVWLTNYATKVTGHATTLGISAGDAAGTVADAKWLVYVLGAWLSDVRTFAQSATAAVDLIQTGLTGGSPYAVPVFTPPAIPTGTVAVPAGALTRIFAFVQRLKSATGYTEAIGEDLGIEGTPETDHPTPKFTLTVEQGATCQCVDFSIVKYTHEGVVIECRRNGVWEQIGVTTSRNFEDFHQRTFLSLTTTRHVFALF